MSKCKWLPALGLALFYTLTGAQAKESVEVIDAQFGIFEVKDEADAAFKVSSTVPRQVGQRYGWIITLKTSLRNVSVREEYLLPNHTVTEREKAADTVAEIYPDRRVQVSQRQLVPVAGKIIGEWEIGPQEPGGRRTLQVIVEDNIAATFEFDVK